MSFLYQDQNLFRELLKIGQQAQPPAGSSAPAASPDQIKAVALKLLNGLQQTAPADQFQAEKDGAELNTKDLISLPALLNFLESNGISTEGHKLTLSSGQSTFSSGALSGEYARLSPEDQKLYMTFPKGVPMFQYYVFKQGLLSYLEDLQRKAAGSDPGAVVLRSFVGKLIQQASSQLGLSIPSLDKAQSGQNNNNQQGQKDQNGQMQQVSYRQSGQEQGQGLSEEQLKMLKPLSAGGFPFLPDRIDFKLIAQWLSQFTQIMSTFNQLQDPKQEGVLQVDLENARMAMQIDEAIMSNWGMTQQPLSNSADQIYQIIRAKGQSKGMEKNLVTVWPRQYLEAINQMLLYLQNALLDFKSKIMPSIKTDGIWGEMHKKLDAQVSNSGSSLAIQNLNVVSQWLTAPIPPLGY